MYLILWGLPMHTAFLRLSAPYPRCSPLLTIRQSFIDGAEGARALCRLSTIYASSAGGFLEQQISSGGKTWRGAVEKYRVDGYDRTLNATGSDAVMIVLQNPFLACFLRRS